MRRRPSLRDIAQRTGLSLSTVSVVLNNKARASAFAEATRARVLEAAQELGYQPNLAARRLRSSQRETLSIGLAVGLNPSASMLRASVDAAQWCAEQSSVPIQLSIEPFVPGKLCELPGLNDGLRYNGLIVANSSAEDMGFLATNKLAMPTVLFNRHHEACNYVSAANFQSGRAAAEFLLRRGRRYPWVLCNQGATQVIEERCQGFLQGLQEAGLPPLVMTGEGSGEIGGYEAMSALLDKGYPCDAIFAVTDFVAIGAMHVLRKAERRIPEDITIIGHDDEQAAAFAAPPLTTYRMPRRQMAQDAVSALVGILSGEIHGLVQRTYESELVVREST
jgi:DNA-binding LacI/PurR family transcriptional regulator